MKNLSLIFCAALLLAACQKSGTPATGEETLAGPVTANPEKAQLYIRVETAGSKAALPIDENAVDDVQILLFGSDGKLETYAREDGSELSMKCTLGPKSIYAFVNMPSLENIRTETEVAGIVFSLEHTTASHLPMQGVVRQSVSTSGNLNILVQRMVCKISIREILTAFPEAYTDARLEIDKIYLTNAVSAIDGDGNIRAWANKLTEQNEYPQMLCDDFAESKIIGGSEDGTLGNIFFAFANATEQDNYEAPWSPRFTRLVIEGKFFNGTELVRTCYYPIPLGPLAANHSYVVSQYTISRPGLDSPAGNPQLLNCEVTVTVKDWDDTHEIIERL